jgi:hypothetical protein
MVSTSILQMVIGAACLVLSVWTIRALVPKEGKPPSAWTSTEMRATAVAIAVLVLMVAGVGLLIGGAAS